MSISALERTIFNLSELIETNFVKCLDGPTDPECFMNTAAFSRYYGCALMLARYDEGAFTNALLGSALIYEKLLLDTRENTAIHPYYLCRSKALPFLDAIATGAFDLAESISTHMKDRWMDQMEYEDDFLYFGIIQELIRKPYDSLLLESLLKSFESSLGGIHSPRFNTVKALIKREKEDFDIAFQDLITQWRTEAEAKSEREHLYGMTEAHIFIEGIALLRITDRLELPVMSDYYYIPKILLQPFNGDIEGIRSSLFDA